MTYLHDRSRIKAINIHGMKIGVLANYFAFAGTVGGGVGAGAGSDGRSIGRLLPPDFD
jgi:hypothetical protein